jgi:hypothetical protein
MPKRGAGDKTLSSNDCSRSSRAKTRSTKALAGGERVEPDLVQDLEKQVSKPKAEMSKPEKTTKSKFSSFDLRSSFELRHSDFVILNHANAH